MYYIQSEVDLYEVCESLFKMYYYYCYYYTNTYFPSVRFVAYIPLWERSLGSIDREAFSRRETARKMSGGG